MKFNFSRKTTFKNGGRWFSVAIFTWKQIFWEKTNWSSLKWPSSSLKENWCRFLLVSIRQANFFNIFISVITICSWLVSTKLVRWFAILVTFQFQILRVKRHLSCCFPKYLPAAYCLVLINILRNTVWCCGLRTFYCSLCLGLLLEKWQISLNYFSHI